MSPEEKDPHFENLLEYLKEHRGFDFTDYKRASLMRRVNKRMREVDIEDYEAYQDYLEVHPDEFTDLFNTILINVTSFFRDPEAWAYLADEIIPEILEQKTPNATVRIWSAGCASGEEAYTLAILMAEAMGIDESRHRVKIYATDVDEQDLAKARRGIYTDEEIEDVPEDLRETYFDRQSNDHVRYIFRQDLRRMLVFGRHDLMHDAPISRLDFLVCRNTLIYFNREAQERIVARFHFALKPHGYVLLGRAETMLTYGDLFEPVKMKHRVFAKISDGESHDQMGALLQAGRDIQPGQENADLEMLRAAFERAPAARLVVDSQGDLVLANGEARERLGLDLRDLGRPFRDLEISYRPVELRSLIDQAREEHTIVRVEDVKRNRPDDDGQEYFDVSVTPLWGAGGRWIGSGITFRDVTERQEFRQKLEQTRHDLETTHEELQSTNEELETSNEELQSTVEELQTTNEELQSSNEEMETMNEELQSANAELQSMNQELLERTRELDRTNAFLESILASVEVGIVVIDRTFEINLWNEQAEELWGLRSEEVIGQSLLELDIGLPVDELKEPVEQFLAGEAEDEQVSLEATNRRGQAIVCRVTRTIRRDTDGEPEGVVLLMETEQR